jgi:dynein heavy chain
MRLLFEIGNLNHATPATVSRAGIIFINAKDVGYKPFLDSWVEARGEVKEKVRSFTRFLCSSDSRALYDSRDSSAFLGRLTF